MHTVCLNALCIISNFWELFSTFLVFESNSANGWVSNGAWESKSSFEGYSSDESFESIEFERGSDENISKGGCLQSNHIDTNSFEKWGLLGCHID